MQTSLLQAVVGKLQAALPSQVPAQEPAPPQLPWGSVPAESGRQVPWLQLWQVPQAPVE
jgi:hypothetical protein